MLKRTTPLRRGGPLKRGARLRSVSTRRAGELKEYARVRAKYLAEHPICEVWLAENGWLELGNRTFTKKVHGYTYVVKTEIDLTHDVLFAAPRATEIHHKAKRRGARLRDSRYFLAVCRKNHERIENNKAWARSKGYLLNF